jgi:hypothetical protein
MLIHACIIGIIKLDTHTDKLIPIPALASLVNDGTFLTVSPDGTNYLGIVRHVLEPGRNTMNVV